MDNFDIISQAMGILGGSKKEETPVNSKAPSPAVIKPTPWLLKETKDAPRAPAPVSQSSASARVSRAERIVVKELARYASLHASILEMKYEMENGANPTLIEQRLDTTLKNAKVTIK